MYESKHREKPQVLEILPSYTYRVAKLTAEQKFTGGTLEPELDDEEPMMIIGS